MAAPEAPAPRDQPSRRRAYIDWARGIAVLVMIEAHAADAWTRAADKNSIVYRDATILGGFAAPLFLWLAGLAVVLAATRTAERTGSRSRAVEGIVRRGLVIFVLAFLFRVQAFIVSPGNHLVTLFRVDILNIMGPAIVAAGLAWAIARSAPVRVALFSASDARVLHADADRARFAAGRAAAALAAVAPASGRRHDGVHAAAVGGVRVCRRGRRRAARGGARRAG